MKASLNVWRIGLMMMKSLRFLLGFLTCVLIAVAAYPHAEAHSGVSLSGYGTATTDGVIGAGEWAGAGKVNFGPFTADGQTITGTLYIMNDGTNLYIAVSIGGDDDLGGAGGLDGFRIMFDNDHGGEASHEAGDDSVTVDYVFTSVFEDDFWNGILLCIDVPFGGTTDGQGAGSRQGALNHFELSHPLDSADDAHDFSLSTGQTVGFLLTVAVDGWAYFLSAYGLGSWLVPSTYANYVVGSAPPVGGILVPMNKLEVLAPYLALLGLVGAVTVAVVVQRRRNP